jgi:hypothetical protein
LLDVFDPTLLLFSSVEGIDKRQKQLFVLATQRARVPPERCVYGSESEAELQISALRFTRCMFSISSHQPDRGTVIQEAAILAV